MQHFTQKKWIAGVLITGIFLMACFAFRQQPGTPPHREAPKNLKILPKNIDHMALIHIMDGYCEALGYKCINCHAPSASGHGMDFASDAKPEKNTARKMMHMVEKLNRKYFKVKGNFADNFNNVKYEVSCYTCHHGSHKPAMVAPTPSRPAGNPPPPPLPPEKN
ncbi:MAG TPA: c-type cytochrome [Chitinophagaceae bacterium]|nr:c-type cytochrome [Chitinophagaceae bacterium]